MYCLQKFQSKFAEVNFRTLSIFINSAFQNNLNEFANNHLFREIFQSIYLKSVTILMQTISFSPDEYIRAEVIDFLKKKKKLSLNFVNIVV
jgi:hypothetical protein